MRRGIRLRTVRPSGAIPAERRTEGDAVRSTKKLLAVMALAIGFTQQDPGTLAEL